MATSNSRRRRPVASTSGSAFGQTSGGNGGGLFSASNGHAQPQPQGLFTFGQQAGGLNGGFSGAAGNTVGRSQALGNFTFGQQTGNSSGALFGGFTSGGLSGHTSSSTTGASSSGNLFNFGQTTGSSTAGFCGPNSTFGQTQRNSTGQTQQTAFTMGPSKENSSGFSFGASNAVGSIFGQTPGTGITFGQTQPQGIFSFGQPTGSSNGSSLGQTAVAIGQATSTGGVFGASAVGGTIFGQTHGNGLGTAQQTAFTICPSTGSAQIGSIGASNAAGSTSGQFPSIGTTFGQTQSQGAFSFGQTMGNSNGNPFEQSALAIGQNTGNSTGGLFGASTPGGNMSGQTQGNSTRPSQQAAFTMGPSTASSSLGSFGASNAVGSIFGHAPSIGATLGQIQPQGIFSFGQPAGSSSESSFGQSTVACGQSAGNSTGGAFGASTIGNTFGHTQGKNAGTTQQQANLMMGPSTGSSNSNPFCTGHGVGGIFGQVQGTGATCEQTPSQGAFSFGHAAVSSNGGSCGTTLSGGMLGQAPSSTTGNPSVGSLFAANCNSSLVSRSQDFGITSMCKQLPCDGLSSGGAVNVDPHGMRAFGCTNPVLPMPPKPILSKSLPRSLLSIWKKPITSISKVKNVITSPLRCGTRFSRHAARRRAPLYRSSGKVCRNSFLRAAATPVSKRDAQLEPKTNTLAKDTVHVMHEPELMGTSMDEPTAEQPNMCSHTLHPIKPNFIHWNEPRTLLPKLECAEYFSRPTIEEMSAMSEQQLMQVDNFEVGRYDHGSIMWPGQTDVRHLDIDQIVSIGRGWFTLYAHCDCKPTKGMGLNKQAVITLNVKPKECEGAAHHVEKWEDRMRKITESCGFVYHSYDLEKWVFSVPHFDFEL